MGFLGLLVMLETIYEWAVKGTPNGYATIVVLLCFMFAMLFVIVGIIGDVYRDPVYRIEGSSNLYRS